MGRSEPASKHAGISDTTFERWTASAEGAYGCGDRGRDGLGVCRQMKWKLSVTPATAPNMNQPCPVRYGRELDRWARLGARPLRSSESWQLAVVGHQRRKPVRT